MIDEFRAAYNVADLCKQIDELAKTRQQKNDFLGKLRRNEKVDLIAGSMRLAFNEGSFSIATSEVWGPGKINRGMDMVLLGLVKIVNGQIDAIDARMVVLAKQARDIAL